LGYLDRSTPTQTFPTHQEAHTKPCARWLQCRDPWVVIRYNVVLAEILHKQNILLQLQQLEVTLQGLADVHQCHRHKLNAIDNAMAKAKKGAKNQFCKLRCGKVQWCPRVTVAINKILFWKSVLKRELGGKVGTTILDAHAHKAGLISVPFVGEYTIKDNISKAYKNFKQLKQDENRQDTWIAQLIAVQAEAWNCPKRSLWKQPCTTERIWKTAHNVRRAFNKQTLHRPLSLVTAPSKSPTGWHEFHQKAELEKACLDKAGCRFTQAKNTPLLTQPLIDTFGECRYPKALCQVLDGHFTPPPGCNPYVAQFLLAVSRPTKLVDVAQCLTQDYCRGWQKAKETTGSSALGIHFGHYMAGTFNPEILIINATMANIPLWTGFSYDRWKKGINVMIKKSAGDFNIEKLHIILLFETDFNANNKWIGLAIMYQAECEQLLAVEQYGSHKYKSAIHQCLNKQLFYNMVQFKWQLFASFEHKAVMIESLFWQQLYVCVASAALNPWCQA